MGDAHILVALVTGLGQADLLVRKVSSWGLATRPWLWYLADKQDASVYIHFCSLGMAQISVCFVDTYGQAGWVTKNHPCRRLLR
jgi:hypothetical protein